ncbi:MAG: NAD(P)H-dependent oxidoreductase [Verrucomicrobia bacterium]|nr:NAD(P)H-dependent oxidoreductase [Verrucomicrobiota bacterium]
MITIISGTNREGSQSLKLATKLQDMYQDLGEEVSLLDLRLLPSESFQPGAYANKPEALTQQFIAPVLGSKGLVVVVPEYNGSFPGVLKLFVDLLPFPESFECRPVAFVGLAAGQFGALRAVEQMQQVFAYRNAHLFNHRVFIPAAYKLFTEDGAIADNELESRLRKQAEKFTVFAHSLSPIKQ